MKSIFVDSLASADHKDAFGIVVSYSVKVKLFLGALGGEVTAELPFILMHPKVTQNHPESCMLVQLIKDTFTAD